MDQAGSSRARRGGELRTEQPPPPAARLGCREGECGGGGGGGQKVSAPAAIPFFSQTRSPDIHNPSLSTCPAPRRPDPGASLLLTPRSLGEGREQQPRTLGAHRDCHPHPPPDSAQCAQAAAVPAPVKAPRRTPAPGKARAAAPPRRCPGPRAAQVPLRPARVHSAAPAQPQREEGAREAAGVPVDARKRPRGPALALRPPWPRRPRPARLLPRGQPGGGGRSARAAAGPLWARRQPGRRCTVARGPARPGGPVGGGRWCAAGEGPGWSRRRDSGAAPPSLQTVMVMSGSV